MPRRKEQEMRAYWNERAAQNAPWYVDTSLQYDEPDMEEFFARGREIVDYAFADAGVTSNGNHIAVEIGSGLGRVCLALAERYERALGIEISPEMAAQARRLVDESRVAFVVADGSSLSLVKSGSVDAVFSFTVFQHIPSVNVVCTYIEEAGRILVPNGLFVFQWNNSGGSVLWAARRLIISLLSRFGLTREAHDRNSAAFIGSRISMRRIKAALARGGLDLVTTKNEGSLFTFAWAVRRP